MDLRRARKLNRIEECPGPVVYWMSRDQRSSDNWALLFAQELALKAEEPLAVVFCPVPQFLGAAIRQYGFMLSGLQEAEEQLSRKDIPFYLLSGRPEEEIPRFVRRHRVGALVTDFDPLRVKRRWKSKVARALEIPFYEVDAHNIVPSWLASCKQEYSAYTFRGKISKLLPESLTGFPQLKRHNFPWTGGPHNDFEKVLRTLTIGFDVPEVGWIEPGERRARRALRQFIKNKLSDYPEARNDPTKDG